MHASKAKRQIHSLLPRQRFSQFLESRASAHVVVWEDKCLNHKCPPLPTPFPELLLLSRTSRSGISLWSVWGSCPSCVPSQLLAYPERRRSKVGRKTKKAFTLHKHCSATVKTLVCYPVLAINENRSTTGVAMKKVNSIRARFSTGHESYLIFNGLTEERNVA